MIAQHAIQFCAEALNRAPTLMIEKMGAKLHGDTVQFFKGVAQQKEFAGRIQR